MTKKKVILTFSPINVEKPITFQLVKNYDCEYFTS